jgi:ribosome-associated protein
MSYTGRKLIVQGTKAKAIAIAQASVEKKATDVLVLNVAKLTSVTDYLVLCSGESERQVRAIADSIDRVLSSQRTPPLSIEGTSSSQWVLMDFGDVVVHIFRSDVRAHYALEKLWGDAPRVRVPVPEPRAEKPTAPAPKRRRSIRAGSQS